MLVLPYSRRGYADGEIEALFAKYDIDGDRVLDEEEQKRMQADLNSQKVALGWRAMASSIIEPPPDILNGQQTGTKEKFRSLQ